MYVFDANCFSFLAPWMLPYLALQLKSSTHPYPVAWSLSISQLLLTGSRPQELKPDIFVNAARVNAAMIDWATSARIPSLIAWNGIAILSIGLFVLGWWQRDEIVLRRVPMLVLVHATMCCLIGNLCAQTIFFDPAAPALTTNAEWFFALSAFLPLWGVTYTIKALVHITDHFTNLRNLHESSCNGTAFDWRIHLNWSERQCYKLIWHTTPRGLFHEADIIHNRWYQGTTAMYHIGCPLFVSFGIYVPVGMAWAGCFSSSSFPQCLDNASAPGIAYYPQFISLIAWFPAMTFLLNVLRHVPDRLWLVAEHAVHYILLVVGVVLYWVLYLIRPGDANGSNSRTIALWAVVSMSLAVSTLLPAVLAASRHLTFCLAARRSSMQQTTDSFQRLLADKELFSQFKKVLAEHFSLENGLFWDDFRELEQMSAAKKPEQSIKEALNRLYLEYVPPGAPRELNLMSRTREAVISDHSNNRLTIRSFDPVKKEVFDMMYSHSLPQFLQQQQQLLQNASGVPGSSAGGRGGMGKRRSVIMASP